MKLTVLIQYLPYYHNADKAVVEVSQRAILVLRLFDWDRTSDDESLGRLGNRFLHHINEYLKENRNKTINIFNIILCLLNPYSSHNSHSTQNLKSLNSYSKAPLSTRNPLKTLNNFALSNLLGNKLKLDANI